MQSKVKLTFDISNFESISENSENNLIGGFSASLSLKGNSLETLSNNCHGGNCASGCGTGQNIKCNTVSGCGVIKE